ncbi:hypothetical protein CHELA1G11_10602 [Hyphomicrobiales bacterium]|nr:hypothetical protein CHELA1G11_10602 [Hyphomicrobiales bacterium]
MRNDYPRVARELIGIITRLREAELAIEAVNTRLVEAGREDERIKAIEHRPDALPLPADCPYILDGSRHSIRYTHLRRVAGVADGYYRGPMGAELSEHDVQRLDVADHLRR